MTDSRTNFELYLLGRMRNEVAVRSALERLRASHDEVEQARNEMIEAGLERPGAPLTIYERLLGEPVSRVVARIGGDHERVRVAFRLASWPTMNVVALASNDGVVSSLRFEHATTDGAAALQGVTSLRPWHNVLADVLAAGWHLTTLDEWYPMLDVEAQAPAGSERALLQFDFDLLQAVHLDSRTNAIAAPKG